MKNVLTKSKLIPALLLSLSLAGCATPARTKCQAQAPLLNLTETSTGIELNDDDLAALLIYITALEECAY